VNTVKTSAAHLPLTPQKSNRGGALNPDLKEVDCLCSNGYAKSSKF